MVIGKTESMVKRDPGSMCNTRSILLYVITGGSRFSIRL